MMSYMGFENVPIPITHFILYQELVFCLHRSERTLRALSWKGSSDLFLRGVAAIPEEKVMAEIFLDRTDEVKDRPYVGKGFYLVSSLPNYLQAKEIAQEANPHWQNLTEPQRREATLLVFQFLGLTLKAPCIQVFCYFLPEGDRTHDWFFDFAKQHGAKLINLADTATLYKVQDYVMENTLFL